MVVAQKQKHKEEVKTSILEAIPTIKAEVSHQHRIQHDIAQGLVGGLYPAFAKLEREGILPKNSEFRKLMS